jgi:hypothetical protein
MGCKGRLPSAYLLFFLVALHTTTRCLSSAPHSQASHHSFTNASLYLRGAWCGLGAWLGWGLAWRLVHVIIIVIHQVHNVVLLLPARLGTRRRTPAYNGNRSGTDEGRGDGGGCWWMV